jgi:putative ABC transport system permease protein
MAANPLRVGSSLRPGLHWPSIRGRAWADRGPLVLTGTVVALTTLLASAVPVLMPRTGDEAVRDAVVRADERADLVINAPFQPQRVDGKGHPRRNGQSVAGMIDAMGRASIVLGPDLEAATRAPVALAATVDLKVTGFGPGRLLQLGYVTSEAGPPAVTWIQGSAPSGSVPEDVAPGSAGQWPVQVGLSEATAADLKTGPGARIQAAGKDGHPVDIRVSGIFRAVDARDRAWGAAPRLLRPVIASDPTGTRVELAALMSADSLPDGRLAVLENEMTRVVTFEPEPRLVTWASAQTLAAAVISRKAKSSPISDDGETNYRFDSGLDRVLTTVRSEGIAAAQQASVLLVGLVASAALLLLLAADLLVRRRAMVLAGTRMRGASLAGLGAELVIESIALTLAGVAVGLLASDRLAGGYTWTWSLPVILVAVLASPVLGTREAARATHGRQAPANRSARRTAVQTGELRRVALEIAVTLAAVAALTALRQRGVVSASPDDPGGQLLSAVAPTLGAITGALIVLRLMPLALRLALNRAARYRGSLPLFVAARAAVTAARPLPLIVLVLCSALLTFSLALAATARGGQDQGAWRAVGADVRLNLAAPEAVPALTEQLETMDGVRRAVSAQVTEDVSVSSAVTGLRVRLVVVDSAAFERLLADTPLPDSRELSRLARTDGGPVPALLRTTRGGIQAGTALTMVWNEKAIGLTDVGTAPTVGDGAGDVMVLDAAAFAAAGAVASPNTIWVAGSGAKAAATAALARTSGEITVRDDVLNTRRQAPLADGIFRLVLASVAVLLLFGLLGVGLGAAVGAPARGEMLARLRTLGLRPGQARRVAFGELLPAVLGAGLGGLLIGVLLAQASLGRLALRLITGQTGEPGLVVPWVSLVPVLLLVLAVAVVVGVESSQRRRERLGQILRAGSQ